MSVVNWISGVIQGVQRTTRVLLYHNPSVDSFEAVQGSGGAINVNATLSGRTTQQVILQNVAATTGQGTAATMVVPFSVDFTVEGANNPVFTITPQMYDNAGNGPFACPVYQTDTTPGLPVYTISATGHSYHVELPGGWSFYANLTALTIGSGITVTVPATVEAN